MAYKISNTDGTTLLILADNTVDESVTSLSLVGKNLNAYGQYVNNNFVRLLANSANTTGNPPRSPLTGQLWYDTSVRRLKVYDGTFKPVTGAIVASSIPTLPSTGDLWWDADNFQLSAFNGSIWTIVGPAFRKNIGDNGWILPLTQLPVRNTSNVPQEVTLLKNYGETIGLISKSTFTTDPDFPAHYLPPAYAGQSFDITSGLTIFGNIYTTGKITAQELDIQYTTVTTVSIKTDDVYTSYNSTPSSSTSTGAMVVAGGIGVNKGIYVGGTVTSTNLVSTSATITNFTATNATVTNFTATNAIITSFTATNATLTNVVVTSKLSMGSNKITNMADPAAAQDAVTRNFLYSRSIVLSMDISDGLNNTGIISYLTQIAPVAEYTTGTTARILCSTVTVSSSTVTLSTTSDTFMLTTSTTGLALTGATASASVPIVSVSRVVKTFAISGGAWTFVS